MAVGLCSVDSGKTFQTSARYFKLAGSIGIVAAGLCAEGLSDLPTDNRYGDSERACFSVASYSNCPCARQNSWIDDRAQKPNAHSMSRCRMLSALLALLRQTLSSKVAHGHTANPARACVGTDFIEKAGNHVFHSGPLGKQILRVKPDVKNASFFHYQP
jgi:hypothetical protein